LIFRAFRAAGRTARFHAARISKPRRIFQKAGYRRFLTARARAGRPLTMWKLSRRDNDIRQWAELGEFESINDAARQVLKLEGYNPLPAVFSASMLTR
jgi:hypothetical protein